MKKFILAIVLFCGFSMPAFANYYQDQQLMYMQRQQNLMFQQQMELNNIYQQQQVNMELNRYRRF